MESANNSGPRFFNRDLSWIDFNQRVLEEGLRQDLPLLDRLRFLSIISSNFDEFFMVRVAALKRALRGETAADPSGLSVEQQLSRIAAKVRSIIKAQYGCFTAEMIPALAQAGLEAVRPENYSLSQMDFLESLFMREIYPVLTPLRIEEDEDLPSIGSLSTYGAFLLCPDAAEKGDPAEEGREHIAVVQIPQALEPVIWLPREEGPGGSEKRPWTLLEDVVMTWGLYLFPGFRVTGSMLFRINRDADFSVDEKRDADFLEAMEEVIVGRGHSQVVRMVFSPESERLKDELARRFELEIEDLYEIDGPLDMGSLFAVAAVSGFDSLREKPWKNYPPAAFPEDEPLWDRIRGGDVLLHLPYQSFDPVVRFFQDAAADPQVIAIKTALYRTSGNSPVIKALEQAALNGKHVTAVVELKARFDEERNISWANRLEQAGVIVVYGLARLKVHAKISLVIRREQEGIKRYVHLSTGNYNDKTAKLYGDIALFTAQDDFAFDGGILFNMITGYSAIHPTRKLVIAPIALKRRLLDLIERETRRSSQEYPGRIMAKMNALADTDVISALYRASQVGVKILLNVRGICALIPGVPGMSENIRVVSVVDRYLEHGRIYYFANGGAEEIFLSSADWMPRNLERRIELMFPVLQEEIRLQVRNILEAYFQDNCHAWQLEQNGSWSRLESPQGEKPFRAQARFLSWAAESSGHPWISRQEFTVRRTRPGTV